MLEKHQHQVTFHVSGPEQQEFVVRDLTEDHMMVQFEKDGERSRPKDFHDNETLSRGLQKLKE